MNGSQLLDTTAAIMTKIFMFLEKVVMAFFNFLLVWKFAELVKVVTSCFHGSIQTWHKLVLLF